MASAPTPFDLGPSIDADGGIHRHARRSAEAERTAFWSGAWGLTTRVAGTVVVAFVALSSFAATPPSRPQVDAPAEDPSAIRATADPRAWLPRKEELRFEVEVSVGPVRGLDVGSVRLACTQAPDAAEVAMDSDAPATEPRRVIASLEALATGGYLGRRVVHSISVRWYAGKEPRIESIETLSGSRIGNRETAVGEFQGRWQLQYRKDRHCKGCGDRAHFTDGFWAWSSPSHCDDCQRPEHRVWREHVYLDVPPASLDIVSALYFARGFVRGESSSTTLPLVNHDELWNVHLVRGDTRKISTPAGKFDCVRVLIGPELAAGDGPGKKAAPRFEALFGLHGDISVWVDRLRGIPVMIEGTAPIGPLDVHVKASLKSHDGP